MVKFLLPAFIPGLAIIFWPAFGLTASDVEPSKLAAGARRPVALVLDEHRHLLHVANRRGTISTIDVRSGRVVSESNVGKQLAWLEPIGGASIGRLLAVDEASHQLLVLRVDATDSEGDRTGEDLIAVERRVAVSRYPVRVAVDEGRRVAYVASLWSRRVAAFSLDTWHMLWQRDLEFAPRVLLPLSSRGRLLVADAFADRIGVADAATGELIRTVRIPGHAFRGLTLNHDGSRVVLAQKLLNELARTDQDDIHWGLLMSNDLRWLKLDQLLAGSPDLLKESFIHPLGEPSRAAADPEAVLMTRDGNVVVAIGGVGEIEYGREQDYILRRLRVGRRPTALASDAAGRTIYIADTFDDTIVVVDLRAETVVARWPLGPHRDRTLMERGERAFYDGRLSLNGWMSCHSCHVDGHTNSRLNDNLSDGSFESSKRVLSLLGRSGTSPFAWNGKQPSLEGQVRASLKKTMRSPHTIDDETVRAMTAYIESLPPPPPLDVARDTVDAKLVAQGRRVFDRRGCAECHEPETYTSPDVYDVGLTDEKGNRRFNPPSLRGVSQRDRWLHDGRASTLRDVFAKTKHGLEEPISAAELEALLAFLRQL